VPPSEKDEDTSRGDAAINDTVVAPVRRAYIPQDEGPVLGADQLQRGYEVAPGRFAVIQPEELRRLRQPTSAAMQILRSVHMEEIDPLFLETSYYIAPGPGGDHSYGLFYRALKESGYAALAEVAMHGRQHVVVIRAGQKGLIAHTMYYVTEVRAGEEHPAQTGEISEREFDLARKFIEAIAEPFRPEEFTDRYREQIESLIASRETVPSHASAAAGPGAHGIVVDIMDALRKSLDKVRSEKAVARKPAAAAESVRARPHKRRA
jgi:DNA end-binding protein Ku